MADLLGTGNSGLNTAAIPQQLLQWDNLVEPAAAQFGIDPALIYAVMEEESGGDPNALSSAGAEGLMQVMPFNAPSGTNLYDPATNLHYGCSILAGDIASNNGDLNQALQSYNGGSYRSAGTAQYAANVLSLYQQYSAGGGTSTGTSAPVYGPPVPPGVTTGTSSGNSAFDTAWQDVLTNVNEMLPYYYSVAIQLRGQIGPTVTGGAGRYQ